MQSKGKSRPRTFIKKPFEPSKTPDYPREFLPWPNPKDYQQRRLQANSFHQQTSRFAGFNSLLSLAVVLAAYLDNQGEYYRVLTPVAAVSLRLFILTVSCVQIALTIRGAQTQLALFKLIGKKDPRCTL